MGLPAQLSPALQLQRKSILPYPSCNPLNSPITEVRRFPSYDNSYKTQDRSVSKSSSTPIVRAPITKGMAFKLAIGGPNLCVFCLQYLPCQLTLTSFYVGPLITSN